MSRFTTRAIVIGAVVGLLGVASYAVADMGKGHLKAGTLTGYEENPDLSTAATGTFEARIIGEKTIAYKLTLLRAWRAPSSRRTSTSGRSRSTAASRRSCAATSRARRPARPPAPHPAA